MSDNDIKKDSSNKTNISNDSTMNFDKTFIDTKIINNSDSGVTFENGKTDITSPYTPKENNKQPTETTKKTESYYSCKSTDFTDGLLKNNPIFVLLLGLCPTLAVTTKVANGLGMGLACTFVLIFSNVIISMLKNFIPEKVRIPSYIVIIASFVTIIELLMQAFLPTLAMSLGVFLPLIVVNCIILGRAEVFASKNTPVASLLDALGTGLGFTFALIIISLFREFPGTLGLDFSDFGLGVLTFLENPDNPMIQLGNFKLYEGAKILTMPAGAFFILGIILAIKQAITNISKTGDEL